MKSHIQMPKCVFKEFAKDNNGFYKYNIQNSVINRGFPKRTFTEEGYYSDTMEKKLNRFVETPLKKLLDFARELPTQSSGGDSKNPNLITRWWGSDLSLLTAPQKTTSFC